MVGGPWDGGGHALAAVGGGVDVARAGGSPLPRVKALVDVLEMGKGVEKGGVRAGGMKDKVGQCLGSPVRGCPMDRAPQACGSPGGWMLCGVTCQAACVSSAAGGAPQKLCLPLTKSRQ